MIGVRVVISDFDERSPNLSKHVMSRTASADGTVVFDNVPLGDHYVEVDEVGQRRWNSALVHVRRHGPAPVISLRWPGTHILKVRSAVLTLIESSTGLP